MRKAFSEVVDKIIREDDRAILLLGDIGVYGFKKTIEDFPLRAINFGIMEQSMVSFASGLALESFIPIVHTIAPFLTERAYEQLKVDFGYQKLYGNFVSVGASYDYASLGCTHHCPSDVGNLLNIPGFEIVVPGTPLEFKQAFTHRYANANPTYFRLTENSNSKSFINSEGEGFKLKDGSLATIIAIGPVLDLVLPVIKNLDVELLYINQIAPLDKNIISKNCKSNKILIVEPFYSGTMTSIILSARNGKFTKIQSMGVPKLFLNNYGNKESHDSEIKFTSSELDRKLKDLIKDD